ncbi:hypothetical protein Daesc_005724 [Daldinia eschscholtzii]|uniref:Uncharacterized protein n=1 Tax=Daldinia eschscholtzii TaxID=292717 RepID=A0AAX6ML80_9PEZI
MLPTPHFTRNRATPKELVEVVVLALVVRELELVVEVCYIRIITVTVTGPEFVLLRLPVLVVPLLVLEVAARRPVELIVTVVTELDLVNVNVRPLAFEKLAAFTVELEFVVPVAVDAEATVTARVPVDVNVVAKLPEVWVMTVVYVVAPAMDALALVIAPKVFRTLATVDDPVLPVADTVPSVLIPSPVTVPVVELNRVDVSVFVIVDVKVLVPDPDPLSVLVLVLVTVEVKLAVDGSVLFDVEASAIEINMTVSRPVVVNVDVNTEPELVNVFVTVDV